MRLIDADDMFSRYLSLLSKHIAEFKLGDAIEMLEDAPTIEAIPVEWLNKKIEHYRENCWHEDAEDLEGLINDWRKEQNDETD